MKITVKSRSLALALVKAAGQLGVTQDQMRYRIIRQSSGFLGLFGASVEVEAWKRGGGAKNYLATSRQASSPVDSSVLAATAEALKPGVAELCTLMLGSSAQVGISIDNDRVVVDIQDKFFAETLQKSPKVAEALEHILRKYLRRHCEQGIAPIFVDAQGARQDRRLELEALAKKLSEQVIATQKPVVLNYRSSYDRKTIHMALDEDERVTTRSMGSGPHRKLMILPAPGAQQHRA